jgi:uncharacterized protein
MMEQRTIGTLAIALAVVVAAFLFANAWTDTHPGVEKIRVTGFAETDFTSDLIVWRASFERRAYTVAEAYPLIKRDAELVMAYLKNKGVAGGEIVLGAVDVDKQFKSIRLDNGGYQSVFDGYRLSQSVEIQSGNVDQIENISREISELLNQGVELSSRYPEYYYTKLTELKIDLLERAAKDGKDRAAALAEHGGGSLNGLSKAEMGVFQITAQNSSEEYTWGGAFNTSAKNKTASITVRMEFEVR